MYERQKRTKQQGDCFYFCFVGLTISRTYSLLEHCSDEKFLFCFVSLLRNFFNERDTEMLLPMFNSVKLLEVRQVD